MAAEISRLSFHSLFDQVSDEGTILGVVFFLLLYKKVIEQMHYSTARTVFVIFKAFFRAQICRKVVTIIFLFFQKSILC